MRNPSLVTTAAALAPGTTLAGFRIEAEIGRGVVYRASQLSLERQVALKLISPSSRTRSTSGSASCARRAWRPPWSTRTCGPCTRQERKRGRSFSPCAWSSAAPWQSSCAARAAS